MNNIPLKAGACQPNIDLMYKCQEIELKVYPARIRIKCGQPDQSLSRYCLYRPELRIRTYSYPDSSGCWAGIDSTHCSKMSLLMGIEPTPHPAVRVQSMRLEECDLRAVLSLHTDFTFLLHNWNYYTFKLTASGRPDFHTPEDRDADICGLTWRCFTCCCHC